jgi:hypothetical protein
MRHSIRKHRKINRRTQKRHDVSKLKYKCVRLRSKSRKHRKIGGAAALSIPPTATFPMVIDKNNVLYSCTAMPTS